MILGINFKQDYLKNKVVSLRTLPTVLMHCDFTDLPSYLKFLRHPYRRKLNINISKFKDARSVESTCMEFTEKHYELYLDIMKKTTTKLELLNFDFFRNLPSNFILTTHYNNEIILSWHICIIDSDMLYFFFGGLNYEKRDQFNSYNNNLLSILNYAIKNRCKRIDFGQTAELSKLRFGGTYSERRMFLYHENKLIRMFIKLFRGFITYSKIYQVPRVFKIKEKTVEPQVYENNLYKAKAI